MIMRRRNQRPQRNRHTLSPQLETLESRAMLSITPGDPTGGNPPPVYSPPAAHFAGRHATEVPTPASALDTAAIQAHINAMAQQVAGNEHYRVTADGNIMALAAAPNAGQLPAQAGVVSYAFPLEDTFKLNSLPGASKTIYLDFDGHTTTNTAWNDSTDIDTIVTPPYSEDADPAFSDAELAEIQRIWERVAEDFLPFEVNVTTADPGLAALVNSGGSDTQWGIRVVMGDDQMSTGAGGIAFIGSFSWSSDTPVFVFNVGEVGAAEAISHEVGHSLGLLHDGRTSPVEEYYPGHGSGATSWAPIMGVGYYVDLVQWSRGEYPNASNKQDDLQIITTLNGFSYRADDHGSTADTATPLDIVNMNATAEGIIERNTDTDYFSFTLPYTAVVKIDLDPFYNSPNLDMIATIRDASGVLVTSNPIDALNASFNTTLPGGDYYLTVAGTGKAATTGDPGYSKYGSLGFYSIDFGTNVSPPLAVDDRASILTGAPSVTIDVLANDVVGSAGFPLDPMSVTVMTQPTQGTVTLDTVTGRVIYTPGTGFTGTDEFTYRMSDTSGARSNVAKVAVRVNRPPVAVDDSATTLTDVPVAIDVLANDTDSEPGGGLDYTSVAIVSQPNNGTLDVDPATGVVTYMPASGYEGSDQFTYTVRDIDGVVSNVATVSLFVNMPPTANDDSVSTLPEVPVTIFILANDSDPTPGGGLVPSSVIIVSAPAHGTYSVNTTNGAVTYTPNASFNGTDTFVYTVNDVHGATSNNATVTITVNAAPIAIDDVAKTGIGVPVTVNVVENDIDEDDGIDASTVQILKAPDHGTATVDSDGVVTYTPVAGFEGGDYLQYRVQDTYGQVSNTATVVFKVGPLHSLSGKVFVDLNDDGIQNGNDWPIEGVTVYLEKTDGTYKYTDLYVTEPDGSYTFTELVTGTYNLREVHPVYFDDGPEMVGTLMPAEIRNDVFAGIALADGVGGTGFNFTEAGLSSEFVAAFLNRQAFFATGEGNSFNGINLGKGDAWVAINGGIDGVLQVTAFASGGSLTLTLYDQNMKQLARSAPGSKTLTYTVKSDQPVVLKVSGTASNVSLSTVVIPPAPPVVATTPKLWHSPGAFAEDVDGDGVVEPQDVLLVADAIRRSGIGSLRDLAIVSNNFLDVDNDGLLTPSDVLPIIDRVNRNAAAAMVQKATGLLASSEVSAAQSHDIAFALAVEGLSADEWLDPIGKKQRR